MKLEEILKMVDHTLLAQGSTWDEIKEICDDGMKYHTASVCIPPYYVKKAREYMGPDSSVCPGSLGSHTPGGSLSTCLER